MTMTVEDIGKFLGKSIEDAMGRPIGKIVGLTADIKDQVTAIQVARSDGEVDEYSIDFVKIIEGQAVILQTWRVEADNVKREHNIISRRNQALDLLLKEGDITQTEYNQQRGNYEDLDQEITRRREALLDAMKQVEGRLEQQIKDLQGALTNNKMLYTASEIDEETYHSVTDSIRAGLEIARKERKDLENTREYLQSADPIEPPKPTAPLVPEKPSIPDFVVIKMKEPLES